MDKNHIPLINKVLAVTYVLALVVLYLDIFGAWQ